MDLPFDKWKVQCWDPGALNNGAVGADRTYYRSRMWDLHVFISEGLLDDGERWLRAAQDAPPLPSLPLPIEDGDGSAALDHSASFHSASYDVDALVEPLNDSEIHQRFLTLVGEAKHTVLATHYTFDDLDVVQAHKAAVARGVSVQVIFDYSQCASHSSSHSQKERLSVLCDARVEMRSAATRKGRGMCHQKCLVVDSATCLIGSANMTKNSRDHSYEFGVCVTQSRTVREREAKFSRLWAEGKVITLELVRGWP